MNSKVAAKKKKTNVTGKSYIFWIIIGVLVLFLLTLLVVRIVQKKDVNSYNKVEEVVGSEIFTQDEDNYFILFYDFKDDEAMANFDKTMYQYLTYRRDNGTKNNAYKLYKAISTNATNAKCLGTTTNITNTTTFPSMLNKDGDDVLKIESSGLPILLVVSEGTITTYYSGENDILTYVNKIMNSENSPS